MFHQHLLYTLRVNILPTTDDHVLTPSLHDIATIGPSGHQIHTIKESFLIKCLSILLWIAEIALEGKRAFRDHLTNLSWLYFLPLRINDLCLYIFWVSKRGGTDGMGLGLQRTQP